MPRLAGSPMVSSTRKRPSNPQSGSQAPTISPEVAQCYWVRAPQWCATRRSYADSRQCPRSSPNAVDTGSSMSVNDHANSPHDAKTGLLNDFSEIASRTVQHLKPRPPSGNVVNSTPAIATRNEGPAPSNGTPPARQRNEVGRPMFSLVYDIQLSMPQRGTSAKLAMRHASTSQLARGHGIT
ncbi:hypothetical protein EV121DRAFT_275815 [Schizophyllum commune]